METMANGRRTRRIELCRTSGMSIAAIARDLDLSETAVRRWLAQAEIDAGERPGRSFNASDHPELLGEATNHRSPEDSTSGKRRARRLAVV